MRSISSVPILGRRIDKKRKLGGYTLPAGAQVFVCPMVLHGNNNEYACWVLMASRVR